MGWFGLFRSIPHLDCKMQAGLARLVLKMWTKKFGLSRISFGMWDDLFIFFFYDKAFNV